MAIVKTNTKCTSESESESESDGDGVWQTNENEGICCDEEGRREEKKGWKMGGNRLHLYTNGWMGRMTWPMGRVLSYHT